MVGHADALTRPPSLSVLAVYYEESVSPA